MCYNNVVGGSEKNGVISTKHAEGFLTFPRAGAKVEETKVTRKLYSELMEQTELAILEGKLTGYMTRDEARQFGATQRLRRRC